MEEERINTGKSTEMELKVYFAFTSRTIIIIYIYRYAFKTFAQIIVGVEVGT